MTFIPHKVTYALPFISMLLVFAVMNWADPTDSVASILLVFLILYIFCASVTFIMLQGVAVIRRNISQRQHAGPWSERHMYYVSSIVAFAPVCLLAMQSLSQIRILDIVLVASMTVLAVFYVTKRTVA